MTLQEMIEKYETLSESEQAHVDAALDSQDDNGQCICGRKLDDNHPDCYSHMTQGY